MGMGKIRFHVFADNLGQPVSNAKITVTGSDTNIELMTDSSGVSNTVELTCPDKKLSLYSQYEKRPYAVYNARVTKTGLKPKFIQEIQILDSVLSFQNVILDTEDINKRDDDSISFIEDHVLWGNYSPKIVVNPFSQMKYNLTGDAFRNPFVPEFVIVHDGLPTSIEAPNYHVSFIDYIKNVATSEIYATWPEECLKANILAIISFTLSRIFTEWYLSKGYPFTITTATQFDQKYIHDRNIAEPISRVVDSIFNTYIKYRDAVPPFFSQYCDGKRVQNDGWLFQWGSKDLAEQGYSAIDILRFYYGEEISLSAAQILPGIPISFPGYDLKYGICGEAVQKAQLELNIISSSYSKIPLIQPAEGVFREQTEEAVKIFQEIFDLPVTGVIDFATWYRISSVYVDVTKMLSGRYIN